jgi:Double zinc ribbon
MVRCPSCGQESPEGFRFCGACGAELAAAVAPREQRKTVTVLFCDVYESKGDAPAAAWARAVLDELC